MAPRNSVDDGSALWPLIRKIGLLIDLTDDEIDGLHSLDEREMAIEPGSDIIADGEEIKFAFVQTRGWAYRYKTLLDGRRQVLNFLLPGDMVGIFGAVRPVSDESAAAHTRVTGVGFDPVRFIELLRNYPRVGAALVWVVARADAIMSEQVLRVGRRTAYERTGHLILELLKRLREVGDADSRAFELEITQELLADCLGLSVVHVNRTLRRMRESGIIHMDEQRLLIDDFEKLIAISEFHDHYIAPEHLPEKALAAIETP